MQLFAGMMVHAQMYFSSYIYSFIQNVNQNLGVLIIQSYRQYSPTDNIVIQIIQYPKQPYLITYNMSVDLRKMVQWLDKSRQQLLKAAQYFAIFLAWFEERNPNKEKFNFFFSIYIKIFHSRKLFRLLRTLNYIPKIMALGTSLKQKFVFVELFDLLSKIFTGLFYAFDNVTIIAMEMKFQYYKVIRRISYGILFLGILFSTISILIGLRKSFRQESDLKAELQNFTPTELLEQLSEIDNERRIIAIKLMKAFGHLFPTLARTNLPQIVLKTKINKGTVGFFGMVSAFSGLYLNNVLSKEQKQY